MKTLEELLVAMKNILRRRDEGYPDDLVEDDIREFCEAFEEYEDFKNENE